MGREWHLRVKHESFLAGNSDDDVAIQRGVSHADNGVRRQSMRCCRWYPSRHRRRDVLVTSVVDTGRRREPARHRRPRRRHAYGAPADHFRRLTLQVGGDLEVLIGAQHRTVNRRLGTDRQRTRRSGWSGVHHRRRVIRCRRFDRADGHLL